MTIIFNANNDKTIMKVIDEHDYVSTKEFSLDELKELNLQIEKEINRIEDYYYKNDKNIEFYSKAFGWYKDEYGTKIVKIEGYNNLTKEYYCSSSTIDGQEITFKVPRNKINRIV